MVRAQGGVSRLKTVLHGTPTLSLPPDPGSEPLPLTGVLCVLRCVGIGKTLRTSALHFTLEFMLKRDSSSSSP